MTRVLVIDDDVDVLRYMANALRTLPCDVMVATDGRTGLSLYLAHRPDLVIVDIYLPERDGLDVILELTAREPVKIIAVSGGARHDDIDDVLRAARDFGATAVLMKPLRLDDLLKTVRDTLGTNDPH
jgi:CheY-like chemotaxis protein